MEKQIAQRLRWVELYERTQNAGLVCLKCGISRPTLRLWLRRYNEHGIEGIEAMNMMRKGQVKRLSGYDAQGQAKFVGLLFGIAA
jgi:transposase-like protein